MKQSGRSNPSEKNGTGCPVTSKYGKNTSKQAWTVWVDNNNNMAVKVMEVVVMESMMKKDPNDLPGPSNGDPIYRFLGGKPAMRTRWMASAASHKSG